MRFSVIDGDEAEHAVPNENKLCALGNICLIYQALDKPLPNIKWQKRRLDVSNYLYILRSNARVRVCHIILVMIYNVHQITHAENVLDI